MEIPELARVFESLSRAGVDLAGVSLDFGQMVEVRSYLEQRSVPYRNYLLNENDVAQLFDSEQITVPLTLLLDEGGRVVRAFSGWSAETRAGIEALLPDH